MALAPSLEGLIFGGGLILLGVYHAVWSEHAAWLNARLKATGLEATQGEIEPTQGYVNLTRFLGVCLVLAGIVVLFAL